MSAVAFIGLGRMGAPMAANLVRAGHEVTVWNRSSATAETFAKEHGCEVAATPAEAARNADVVISMLADDAAVTSSHTSAHGSLAGVRDGAVVVDMSTVSPGTARALAAAAAQHGAAFLDAPVSGSVKAATEATLTIMVGGAEDAFVTVRPVLEAMGTPLHLGGTGIGVAMKLAVNTVVHALNGALSEALVLAEESGIERKAAYEVFSRSAVAAPFVAYRRDAFERPGEIPVAFRLDLAAKDLRYALELAGEVGTELPHADRALSVLVQASEAGLGDHDESAVAEYLRHH